MGLDMYIKAERYLGNWDHTPAAEREQAQAAAKNVGIDKVPGNSVTVSIAAAYWRKANAIHRWFVANCQGGEDDCKSYYVSETQLRELIDLCKTCLKNQAGAKEHLPTQGGFFFGSTDYGEGFRDDLELTIAQLEPLLTDPKWERFEFYYRASW